MERKQKLYYNKGLWYRDKNVRKQKAEGKDRVKKTNAERAVEQIRKHAYKVELPEDKEYQIVKLLGEARRLNPTALPFFNDEEEEEDKGKGKGHKKHKSKQGDDVAFVPFYDKAGPSTSQASTSRNTTSELRGQVEVKYQHIEESDFKRNFLNSISGTLEEKIEAAMANNFKLLNDPMLDTTFKKEMVRKLQSRKYQEMMEVRKKLPSFKMRDAILDLINNNQISVISGETGCGKTTQVPQFILDDMIAKNKGSECFIMVTQPRRISAIAIAERVAQERDEDCGRHGSSVGYQIRLEKELPRKRGSMLYCTAGILPEIMQSDPILSGVSHIIMDEIHERSMISDFLLAILKDVTNKRKDLKLVLMSATLNAEKFSEFFGGAPILHIPGFTFPVNEYYLEDVLHMTRFRPSSGSGHNQRNQRGGGWGGGRGPNRDVCNDLPNIVEPYIRGLRRGEAQAYPNDVLNMLKDPELEGVNNDVIISLLQYISTQRPGAVLVFLPGWDTINSLHRTLCQSKFFNSSRFQIIPLHSMLPTVSQKAIFNTPPEGVRKIVLATNIAETSITIDDIVYVVDCGKTKMNNFDVKNNIATLKPEWISLANARQRRGRAGRVQEGVCYHLYSRAREQTFQDYPLPEIQRTRLDEVVLKAKMLQLGKIAPFLQKLLDPPDEASVHLSLKLLRLIDALDDDEHLTPLGYHLAKLPLDPQIGKMLLMASIFSCVDPVFTVAASLGFKDAFYTPMNMEKEVDKQKTILAQGATSDYTVLINAMKGWETALEQGYSHDYCRENFLTNNTLLLLRDMKDQFSRHLHDMKFIGSNNPKAEQANLNSHNTALVNAIIASGLYPNVGVIKRTRWNNKMNKHFSSITTPDDGKVCIHPKSVNSNQPSFDSPFLMYYMKLKGTGAINLHDTSSVYPLPLIFFAHDMKSHMVTKDTEKNRAFVKHRHGFKDNKPKEIITVRDCLSFECKPSTAKLIKELRTRLNMLLAHKLSHPGTTEWGDPNEGNILLAMIELITNEDKRNQGDDYSDEEDNDYVNNI
uniref:RNA helicase n=1 Tax=Cacopsylla melanoneura TaxID=428564 RepID=A0A8D8LV21_9HEMI